MVIIGLDDDAWYLDCLENGFHPRGSREKCLMWFRRLTVEGKDLLKYLYLSPEVG